MGSTRARLKRSGPWTAARSFWYRGLEDLSPAAFCAWNRRFPERTVVDRDTDLVIEGYPSAANSLVRQVLYHTQPGIRLASHVHSAAHVRRAIDLGVPTLVLLRPPLESVSSLMARYPERGLKPRLELERYRRFYSTVLARSEQVALARFEDTVTSLSCVISEINRQFGTGFAPFDDGDSQLFDQVFATLDYWSAQVSGSRFEVVTPRPSPARSEAIAEARRCVETASDQGQLDGCRELHDRLARIAVARRAAAGLPGSTQQVCPAAGPPTAGRV